MSTRTLLGHDLAVPVDLRVRVCAMARFLFRVNPALRVLVLRREGHEDIYYTSTSLAHLPAATAHQNDTVWSIPATRCYGRKVSPEIDALSALPGWAPSLGPDAGSA